MKKLVIGGLLAASTVAHAQSSVTLYGLIDESLEYVSNVGGHSLYQMANVHSPDFWGLRGSEDLGGGLNAIFDLQSEFFLGNGNMFVPGELFNRRAMVGLQSDTYGTLTLGHQPTFMYDVLSPYESGLIQGNLIGLHEGNFDEVANFFQFNNALKYVSPVYHGFKFGSMFGFGNTAGNFATGRNYGFFVQYKSGPLSVGAVYENENDRYLEAANFVGLKSFLGTSLPTPALVANKLVNMGVGASYNWNNWLLHAAFSQSRITLPTGQGNANTVDFGVNWTVVPDDIIGAGAFIENLSGGDWKSVTLSNSYILSKRTNLYQQVTYQKASGANALASFIGAGTASGKSSVGVVLGIQHSF